MGCTGRLDCHACLPLQAWQPLICHLALSFGPGFALGNPQVWAQCRPLHAAHGFFAADPIACERDGVGARQASEGGSERRCAQPFSSLPNLSHLRRRRRRWGQRPTRLGCAKAPWPRRFLFFYTPLALSTRHGPWESVGFNRRPTTNAARCWWTARAADAVGSVACPTPVVQSSATLQLSNQALRCS